MKIHLKNVRHIILIVSGGVIAVCVAVLIVHMFSFLLSNLTAAVNVDIQHKSTVRFDTDGFEKLNLIKRGS